MTTRLPDVLYGSEVVQAAQTEQAYGDFAQFIDDISNATPSIADTLPYLAQSRLRTTGKYAGMTVTPLGLHDDYLSVETLPVRREDTVNIRYTYEQPSEDGMALYGLRLWCINNKSRVIGLEVAHASAASVRQEIAKSRQLRGPAVLPIGARSKIGHVLNPKVRTVFEPLSLQDASTHDVLAGFAHRFYGRSNAQTNRTAFRVDSKSKSDWN